MENLLVSDALGSKMFATNAGIITSNGPYGPNIMTAAWTHHISYNPPLVMVNVESPDATLANILATKEFGIHLASESQNVLSSVAGKFSGRDVDKIALLKEMGFEFYNGEKIKAPMVKGAALSAEAKLIKHEVAGDHVILVGQVLLSRVDESVRPAVYSGGKYWKLGENISKPGQEILDKISELGKKHKK